MAFEFDTVVRGVDIGRRAWPLATRGGGLYDIFNTLVSTDIDLWRPDNLHSLPAQARHTYLQWAVADHLLTKHGQAGDHCLITMAELFDAGPVYLRVATPKHDWTAARREWMRSRHALAARNMLRDLAA